MSLNDRERHPVVWIVELGLHGIVIQTGAYYSNVAYSVDGIRFEECFSNSELITRKEVNFRYEQE